MPKHYDEFQEIQKRFVSKKTELVELASVTNGSDFDNLNEKVQIMYSLDHANKMIEKLKKSNPCRELSIITTKLQEAEMWLDKI